MAGVNTVLNWKLSCIDVCPTHHGFWFLLRRLDVPQSVVRACRLLLTWHHAATTRLPRWRLCLRCSSGEAANKGAVAARTSHIQQEQKECAS